MFRTRLLSGIVLVVLAGILVTKGGALLCGAMSSIFLSD